VKTLSVIELTRKIKSVIEQDFPILEIEGEISNYKTHFSGHAYFTLKDEYAQISAVMWRSNFEKINFDFKDGKKIICRGKLTVYEKTGRYQIVVSDVEESGKGNLHLQFEKLKKKLQNLGYFDEFHKKRIPSYPEKIGIVTSPTGAAIEDMKNVAMRRNSSIQFFLRPAQVQGKNAAKDIANAINEFQDSDVDVIVIGRGGGSLEDLWAFNEEIVAQAVYESKIPIVSAVGHEVDFSISDFVADMRAPTPSAAIEIVVPDKNEMIGQLRYYEDKIYSAIFGNIQNYKEKVAGFRNHYALKRPESMILLKKEKLKNIQENIFSLYENILHEKKLELSGKSQTLSALSPKNVLKRGFSIVKQNDKIIKNSKKLDSGKTLFIFHDAEIEKEIK
jgi:exodeoxyribonuclease VII large subunit